MSYEHDGTAAARIAVPHDTELDFGGTAQQTISAWVTLPSGVNQIQWAALLAKLDNTWRVSVIGNNDYGWHFHKGGSALDVTHNNNDDILHHYCFVSDGTNKIQYEDGVNTGSNAQGSVGTNTGELWLGNNSQQQDRGLQGRLEDIRLYNRGLSLEEVQGIYHGRGHDGIVDGLVARWMFQELHPGQGLANAYDVAASATTHDGTDTSPAGGVTHGEGDLAFRRRCA